MYCASQECNTHPAVITKDGYKLLWSWVHQKLSVNEVLQHYCLYRFTSCVESFNHKFLKYATKDKWFQTTMPMRGWLTVLDHNEKVLHGGKGEYHFWHQILHCLLHEHLFGKFKERMLQANNERRGKVQWFNQYWFETRTSSITTPATSTTKCHCKKLCDRANCSCKKAKQACTELCHPCRGNPATCHSSFTKNKPCASLVTLCMCHIFTHFDDYLLKLCMLPCTMQWQLYQRWKMSE